MKLVSTKRTEAEKKAEKERYSTKSPVVGGGDEYPYDTRLCLNKTILGKLGISPKDFKVDQKVDVQIVAHVKSLRSSEGKEYESSEIELQIEKIGLEKRAASAKDAVYSAVKGAK